jgi:hypothetical protein
MKTLAFAGKEKTFTFGSHQIQTPASCNLQCSYNLNYMVFGNYLKFRIAKRRNLLTNKHTFIYTVSFYVMESFCKLFDLETKWQRIASHKASVGMVRRRG